MALPMAKTNSVMMCDKGTAPAPLVASGSATVKICDVFLAAVSDVEPGANISPFGTCIITRSVCSPAPVGFWTNPFDNACIVGGVQSLLEGAKLPCAIGGVISLMSAEQATVLVGENLTKYVQEVAAYMAQQMRQNAGGLLDLLRLDTVDVGLFRVPREPDQPLDIMRALERFINNVRQGGEWDYKTKLWDMFDPISGTVLKNDIWGNMHFGYVGSALGFPTSVLKSAGDADTLASDLKNNAINLARRDYDKIRFPRRDDPRDQAAIEIGAKLWRARGLEITEDDLLDNVRANADKLK
jgi:hypothetical protein